MFRAEKLFVSLNWFSEQTTIIFPNVISRIDLFRNILSIRCVFLEVKTILFYMIRIPIALEIFRHATRMVLPIANAAQLADRRGLSGISCVCPCSVETKRCPARSGGGGSAQCSGKRVDHTYSCHFLPIPSRHVFCCLHLPHPVFCGNQLLYCIAQQ
jgi:hypothetical protein